MDGVLWKDDTPIGDLHAIFDRIHAARPQSDTRDE